MQVLGRTLPATFSGVLSSVDGLFASSAAFLFRYLPGDSLAAATFTRPSTATYIDANGVVQTAASGAARDAHYIGGVRHLLLEGQRTNALLWNRDLTNAAWAKTSVAAVKDQTGVDGVAGSASRITATAANGTCLQAITLASSARFQSAWVKRLAGVGTIQMATDGVTWNAVTVTATWTRVSVPSQTIANPSAGFRIVTSGDSIAVDYAQNEGGQFQSSEILTTTAAVTRISDALVWPFPSAVQPMSAYIKAVFGGGLGEGAPRAMQIGSADNSTPFFVVWGTQPGFTTSDAAGTQLNCNSFAASPGDVVELNSSLLAAVQAQLEFSSNGGAKSSELSALGTGMPVAWSAARLALGCRDAGVDPGFYAVEKVIIRAGFFALEDQRAA